MAMMKAAINETEDMPMFEPKMTRSKLEKGVAPQFVDIPLEEEDSSDEEYQPEEEEEDETAEESLLESDVESTSSSPRGPKGYRATACELMETDEEAATSPETKVSAPPFRHVSAEVVPMGPPPPPPKLRQSKDSMFMEKLHAVDEELASSPVCMDSFQVSRRFKQLMRLFHTSCDVSSEEEEDGPSNTEQLSDRDVPLSEEEDE
uniref:GON-4-like protein n=1 Tax=Geotrypetes seraphini TaxID=260995 RepID=A0A6P8PCZ6_GEOSA|nr:GON-4-like protein [Geotrypetes seraphini]